MPGDDILDLNRPRDRLIYRKMVADELRFATIRELNAQLPLPKRRPRGTSRAHLILAIANERIAKIVKEPT